LPFQVFNFEKSNYCDSIAKDEFSPIHLTRIHLITFGGNAIEPYHKLQPKLTTLPEFKDAHYWFGLPYQRKSILTTPWKTSANDYRHVSQLMTNILNIKC